MVAPSGKRLRGRSRHGVVCMQVKVCDRCLSALRFHDCARRATSNPRQRSDERGDLCRSISDNDCQFVMLSIKFIHHEGRLSPRSSYIAHSEDDYVSPLHCVMMVI